MQLLLLAASSIHPLGVVAMCFAGVHSVVFIIRPPPPKKKKINGLKSGERGVQGLTPPPTPKLVPIRYLAHNTCLKMRKTAIFWNDQIRITACYFTFSLLCFGDCTSRNYHKQYLFLSTWHSFEFLEHQTQQVCLHSLTRGTRIIMF
jgi:hypothetical protein